MAAYPEVSEAPEAPLNEKPCSLSGKVVENVEKSEQTEFLTMADKYPDLSNNIFDVLADKKSIYIKQDGTMRAWLECITGCDVSNRFSIRNSRKSDPLFHLKEDSNCCVRQCCKTITPFIMELNDPAGNTQLVYERPFHCTNSNNCFPCGWMCNFCAYDCCCGVQELIIKTNNGDVLGTVVEDPHAWCGFASYTVSDADGKPKFTAMVPCCSLFRMCCCTDVDLAVMSCAPGESDTQVANIARKCVCTCTNVVTDKDNFECSFDAENLTPLDKFYIMSLVILIKYMHFEEEERTEQNSVPHN